MNPSEPFSNNRTVKPIPDGYHSVTPYLIIDGAGEALAFYQRAFGAVEIFRLDAPGGKVGHAEISIGNSRVMLADACEESPARSPQSLGGSSVMLHLYVEDSDAVFARAVAAGAKGVRPVKDQFYGDRSGAVQDPFGHIWHLSTHKEELTPEEIKRRAEALFGRDKA